MFTDLYSQVIKQIGQKVEEEIKKVQRRNSLSLDSKLSSSSLEKIPLLIPNSTVTSGSYSLIGRHILSVDMFTKEQLNEIFDYAQTLRVFVIKQKSLEHILKVSIYLYILLSKYGNK